MSRFENIKIFRTPLLLGSISLVSFLCSLGLAMKEEPSVVLLDLLTAILLVSMAAGTAAACYAILSLVSRFRARGERRFAEPGPSSTQSRSPSSSSTAAPTSSSESPVVLNPPSPDAVEEEEGFPLEAALMLAPLLGQPGSSQASDDECDPEDSDCNDTVDSWGFGSDDDWDDYDQFGYDGNDYGGGFGGLF